MKREYSIATGNHTPEGWYIANTVTVEDWDDAKGRISAYKLPREVKNELKHYVDGITEGPRGKTATFRVIYR